jgi:hypothetical protein
MALSPLPSMTGPRSTHEHTPFETDALLAWVLVGLRLYQVRDKPSRFRFRSLHLRFSKRNNAKALVLDDNKSLDRRSSRLSLVVYFYMAGSQFELLMNNYQSRPTPISPTPNLPSCLGSNKTDCLIINSTSMVNFTAFKPMSPASTS